MCRIRCRRTRMSLTSENGTHVMVDDNPGTVWKEIPLEPWRWPFPLVFIQGKRPPHFDGGQVKDPNVVTPGDHR